jgi:hypothetical protein
VLNMHDKVSMRLLLRAARQAAPATNCEYVQGKAAGARWVDAAIVARGRRAPFAPDFAESPYNIGVVHGIARELRTFADGLVPSAEPPAPDQGTVTFDADRGPGWR